MLGASKEKATGIMFPKQCNGFMLAGTGVRVKYGFVKVYAVGTYLDPLAMSGLKGQPKEVIQKALLNPMYPRTIRIVMARGLSIQKFTDALNESLKPRMGGEDLQTWVYLYVCLAALQLVRLCIVVILLQSWREC